MLRLIYFESFSSDGYFIFFQLFMLLPIAMYYEVYKTKEETEEVSIVLNFLEVFLQCDGLSE